MNSNTTLVKVKLPEQYYQLNFFINSNTTLVKVKLYSNNIMGRTKSIQIQHLLKLNLHQN